MFRLQKHLSGGQLLLCSGSDVWLTMELGTTSEQDIHSKIGKGAGEVG
jgi:hypothetical protein